MSAVAVLADTDADAVVYSSGRPRDLAAKLFGRELDDLSAGTALRCDDHVAALYTSWVLHQRGPATSAVSQHRILKRASQARSWHVSGPVHTRVKSTTICRVHYSTSGRAPRQPSGEALLTSRGITYRTCHRPLQCASMSYTMVLDLVLIDEDYSTIGFCPPQISTVSSMAAHVHSSL